MKTTKIELELQTDVDITLFMKNLLEQKYQQQFVIMRKQLTNICMIAMNKKKHIHFKS